MGQETNQPVAQAPAADSPAPESGVNWADLAVDVDGGAYVEEFDAGASEPAAPAVQAPATASPPAQQPQQPVQGQQPAPQSSQAPAASPETSQPQGQTQEPAQQPAQAIDPAEWSRQYHTQLQTEYAINEEDALALSTTPETVMPKLAANMHMRIMQDVMQQMQQIVAGIPQILQQHTQRTQAEESAKQEFYGEWPGLASHHDKVLQNAIMVRQANPQATRQQVVEMAGLMTAMSLGVDPMSVRKQAGGASAPVPRSFQPVQVQQPMRPAGVIPAQGGAVGHDNLFESFANEDIDWLKG